MLLKYILSLALIVGCLAAPKIILNELDVASKKVEILVLDDSYSDVSIQVFDAMLFPLTQIFITAGLSAGSVATITINIPTFHTSVIVLYDELFPIAYTQFLFMDKAKMYDSLVISTLANAPNAFSSKLPEWDNKVIQYTPTTRLSRCFKQDSHAPKYWFERPETLENVNDCPAVDPNAGGDPHFSQKVFDQKSKELVNICYDITGRSGQLISILYDNSTNTKVEGVLKDDYYMHEIRIQFKAGLIVVGQSSILVNNEKLPWVDSSEYKFDFVSIRMAKGRVFLESFYENSKLTTVVEKGFRKFSGSYLNVYFQNIDIFYKGYGGLLGDIGRKSYVISDGIQLNYKTVQVDDVFLSGSVAKRFSHECILLPVKRLLSPNRIDDYVY